MLKTAITEEDIKHAGKKRFCLEFKEIRSKFEIHSIMIIIIIPKIQYIFVGSTLIAEPIDAIIIILLSRYFVLG